MSDDDLIRRGDAIREIDCGGCYGHCANPSSCQQDDVRAIRALPAAQPAPVTVEEADSFNRLILDARAEADKAMRKFPQPNYVISKVAEESGEVVKAAIHYAEGRETPENVRGEMKQLIAMLIRLWVEGDRVHGMPPVCPDARALAGDKP
jgi:hypothetical protein